MPGSHHTFVSEVDWSLFWDPSGKVDGGREKTEVDGGIVHICVFFILRLIKRHALGRFDKASPVSLRSRSIPDEGP